MSCKIDLRGFPRIWEDILSTIYVAGPMRGIPDFNFPAFDEAARKLRELGWTVFSPADNDRANGFDPVGMGYTGYEHPAGFDLCAALKWDLCKVLEVDAIYLLPGWLGSRGAQAEYHTALAAGKDVYTFLEGYPAPHHEEVFA